MQDDWFIWLFITEFIDNNAISFLIEQLTFFLNKNFHFHMNFNSDSTEYEITYARIEADKAENIFKHIKWSLALIKQALAKVRVTIKKQIDKHWKKMIYKINNMMFLNSRNIMILRSSKKLNNKMLKLFKILVKIEHVYQLKLLSTIKILISLKSVVESELSWVERDQLNLILSLSWDWVNLFQLKLNSKSSWVNSNLISIY